MFSLADLRHATELVHAHLQPSPQICWPLLSRRTGTEVWVKHENHTPIGSFKVRGGIVYFDRLKRQRPDVRRVQARPHHQQHQPAQRGQQQPDGGYAQLQGHGPKGAS